MTFTDKEADTVTFSDDAQFEAGRVESGGGPGMGGKLALGGGAGGIIVLVLTLLLGGDPGSIIGNFTGAQGDAPGQSSTSLEHCKTGADANKYLDCRIALTAQSLDDVWAEQLPRQANRKYEKPGTKLFSGAVQTACGRATSDVGPFYCPADKTAYFDTSFFQVLSDRFGSSTGPLAQEYVVAHEFGHHITNSLGALANSQRDPKGAQSGAVRAELQADCYAGLWAHYAAATPSRLTGKPLLKPLTEKDIRDALSAAASVGDDHIQKQATGRVNQEAFTHGSSLQRQKWFTAGYQTGQMSTCDTFRARDLDNPGR